VDGYNGSGAVRDVNGETNIYGMIITMDRWKCEYEAAVKVQANCLIDEVLVLDCDAM
jgi:hypothetical protein